MYKKLIRSLNDNELQDIDENFRVYVTTSWTQRLIRKLVYHFSKIVFSCFYRIRVFGRDKLPTNEPFFLCSNHLSHLDHAVLIVATGISSDQFIAMAAKDYFFHNPWLCHLMSMFIGIIPVERCPNSGSLSKNLRYLEKCKQLNKNIIFYPEGTRSSDGNLGRFRSGIGLFATRLQLKVVPAYIKGTFDYLPKGRFIPRPGTLSVAFGDALTVNETISDKKEMDDHRHRRKFVDLLRKNVIELERKHP